MPTAHQVKSVTMTILTRSLHEHHVPTDFTAQQEVRRKQRLVVQLALMDLPTVCEMSTSVCRVLNRTIVRMRQDRWEIQQRQLGMYHRTVSMDMHVLKEQ